MEHPITLEKLKAIPSMLTADPTLASQANLGLVFETFSDPNPEVRSHAVLAVRPFVEKNKALLTEENLRPLLRMVADTDEFVRAVTLHTTSAFVIREAPIGVTIRNAEILLEIYESGVDPARSYALLALGMFFHTDVNWLSLLLKIHRLVAQKQLDVFTKDSDIQSVLALLDANQGIVRTYAVFSAGQLASRRQGFATEENLQRVLAAMRSDPREDMRWGVLEVLPKFLEANKGLATPERFGLVMAGLRSGDHEMCNSALEALPSFFQAKPSLAAEELFLTVCGFLHHPNDVLRHSAWRAIPSFVQANHKLATEQTLKMIIEMESAALDFRLPAVSELVLANPRSFTLGNLDLIRAGLMTQEIGSLKFCVQALAHFVEADRSYANDADYALVLRAVDRCPKEVLNAIPVFLRANANLALDASLELVLGKLHDSDDGVVGTALHALGSFAEVNPEVPSKAHADAVWAIFGRGTDSVRSAVLRTLDLFLRLNPALSDQDNLSRVVDSLSDGDAGVRNFARGMLRWPMASGAAQPHIIRLLSVLETTKENERSSMTQVLASLLDVRRR